MWLFITGLYTSVPHLIPDTVYRIDMYSFFPNVSQVFYTKNGSFLKCDIFLKPSWKPLKVSKCWSPFFSPNIWKISDFFRKFWKLRVVSKTRNQNLGTFRRFFFSEHLETVKFSKKWLTFENTLYHISYIGPNIAYRISIKWYMC